MIIVAELSCNHQGSLDRAMALVDAAADAGADAIKLQTWTPGTMVSDRSYVMTDGPWKGQNLSKLYEEAWTPWEWHNDLFDRAEAQGMKAFSTPFDLKALAFLEELGCPLYKIASFSLINLSLIRAIAATRKPIIISTGMATEPEIWAALDASSISKPGIWGQWATLLKCTSAYPADASDANLATMVDIGKTFGARIGLSDHTPGIGVAVAAAALGATVIEKHLTLLRADGGPDAAFSMEPDEFKAMATACRQATAAIGPVRYGPTESEKPMLEIRRVRNEKYPVDLT